MGQIKKLYQDSGNVETIVSTEELAVYPITASTATYHPSAWGTLGSDRQVSEILSALNQGYQYIGLATPSTNPGTYTHKVFYIAGESGTYTNFGNIEVSGLTILKTSGSGWSADSVGISGGGGGTGGDTYIGKTKTQSSAAAQALTGITSMTLEGAAQRIYFGDTSHFIEWDATNSAFHFSHGLYSNGAVSAGGVGTGGGGGGVSNLKQLTDVYHNGSGVLRSDGTTNALNGDSLIYDSTNSRWYASPSSSTLAGLTDVYDNLNPSVNDVLYYSGSTNGWSSKALSIKDLSDVYSSMSPTTNQVLSYDNTNSRWTSKTLTIQELAGIASPTTGYLKYNNGAWSLAEGTSGGGISSVTWDTTGITTTGWTPIGDLVVDGTHSTILAPAGGSGSVTITGKKFSSSTGSEMVTINGEKLYCAKDTWRHVIVGSTEVLSNNDITALKFDGSQFSWSQYNGITYIGGGGSPSSVGSLSISSSSQSVPSSAESFANSITLHKIAKTGSYNDLSNTPTIPSTLDDISNGSSRKLPIGVSTSIGGTAGQPTVEAELIYSGTTTTAQLPFAECATVVQTAGIVSTVSQNFIGKKTFSSDVTVGPYSNQTSITRSNEPKLYFGRSINRTTSYPQTLDNVVANTAEGYYMLYDPSTNEKCLHLYCGYNDAGTDVLTNVNHKFVIHGDLVVDGNIIAASQTVNGVKQNGNVLAEGAVTAGESSV